VYELLDEIIDFGYPQVTNTEQIKSFVFNAPILVKSAVPSSSSGPGKLFDMNPKTTPSTSVDKPINYVEKSGKKKNEIFVDIYERISITFNANGYILNSNIDGTIQMKSYLAGNPELKLALNEDLSIGKQGAAGRVPQYAGGVVEVDDVNFHECAKLDQFDSLRILSFQPPDGEFVLMNYRITGDTFRAPFRLFPFFELISPYKVELVVKVRAQPGIQTAGLMLVRFPRPPPAPHPPLRYLMFNIYAIPNIRCRVVQSTTFYADPQKRTLACAPHLSLYALPSVLSLTTRAALSVCPYSFPPACCPPRFVPTFPTATTAAT